MPGINKKGKGISGTAPAEHEGAGAQVQGRLEEHFLRTHIIEPRQGGAALLLNLFFAPADAP